MTERACVFTVLLGQYEELLEQPVAAESAIPFICFTDDPTLTSRSWEIRLIEPLFPQDLARSSRYPKICPHVFLDDYDISIYIDNSVLLIRSPEEILDALLPKDEPLAAVAHSFRETVADEFRAVLESEYDTEWVLAEQFEHYRRSFPEVLDMRPLNGGVLLRRHLTPDLIEAMELWWFNVLRYSRRDQLSFRVALLQASFDPLVWPLDMRDSGFWKWPANSGRDWSVGESSLFRPRDPEAERQIADLSSRVSKLEPEIEVLNRAIEETRIAADRARHQQSALEAEIGMRDRTIHELGNTINRRDDEVSQLAEEASTLSAANLSLGQQIDAMRQSNSWRMTRVLRSVGDLARRARLIR